MSIARQFNVANLGGDPKLKLPLVAAAPQTALRKETAARSAIAQIAKKCAPAAKLKRGRKPATTRVTP
jgi:hypothetical protein